MKAERIRAIERGTLALVLLAALVVLPSIGRTKERVDIDREISTAIALGDDRAVKSLLTKGADVNSHGTFGPPLIQAASRGNTKMVKLLLDEGADVDSRDRYGSTALMWAASGRDAEMAKILLKKGADLLARDTFGMTALTVAAHYGSAEVVKLLLDKGSRVSFRDQHRPKKRKGVKSALGSIGTW